MAADYIMTTGGMILITMNPPDTYPTMIAPIPLIGTSADVLVNKMSACLDGDETPPLLLAPQPYISPVYSTSPGMGMVTITINSSNKTVDTKNGGKEILITGQTFQVEFDVTVPAILVAGPVVTPDSTMKKTGTAKFINTNFFVKAG